MGPHLSGNLLPPLPLAPPSAQGHAFQVKPPSLQFPESELEPSPTTPLSARPLPPAPWTILPTLSESVFSIGCEFLVLTHVSIHGARKKALNEKVPWKHWLGEGISEQKQEGGL